MELKPCPFCGGNPYCDLAPGSNRRKVGCHSCGISTMWYVSKKDAIEAWNRRV